jgi:hypothetical protein
MSNKINYTEMDKVIVSTLKTSETPLALCEISEAAGVEIKPGHITSAVKKGLVVKSDEPRIVDKPTKKTACTYMAGKTIEEVLAANPKTNFTDNEKALATAVFGYSDNTARTASMISEDAGLDKPFASGVFTSLVKKGVLVKGDEVSFTVKVPTKANAYTVAATLPADFDAE